MVLSGVSCDGLPGRIIIMLDLKCEWKGWIYEKNDSLSDIDAVMEYARSCFC